jgi:hypothetical protein
MKRENGDLTSKNRELEKQLAELSAQMQGIITDKNKKIA